MWDEPEPGVLTALREFAKVDLGGTLGREQVRELVAYIDALKEECVNMWSSAVESSEY